MPGARCGRGVAEPNQNSTNNAERAEEGSDALRTGRSARPQAQNLPVTCAARQRDTERSDGTPTPSLYNVGFKRKAHIGRLQTRLKEGARFLGKSLAENSAPETNLKIKSILLRWYKSFNISYTRYPDRRESLGGRLWNSLHSERFSNEPYPFVEIPIESDITTIVGANESGKSHLLNAILKVLTGAGAPSGNPFSRTDLCLYAAPRSQNTDLWPYIGLEFQAEGAEVRGLAPHLRIEGDRKSVDFGLIVSREDGTDGTIAAYLFVDETKISLSEQQLHDLRKVLPSVRFLKSTISIASSVELADLLVGYGDSKTHGIDRFYPVVATQEAARDLMALPTFAANQPVNANAVSQLEAIKEKLRRSRPSKEQDLQLELLLFRDLLGITCETLDYISGLGEADRSYIEGIVDSWNREIDASLNLSRYWQQDEAFNLRVNCKRGIIYFEITDKTGATYTFRDRSSGLRYFLSYYIQAKALQSTGGTEGSIVLMDEPDSFLSIAGQRNLLSVFESLVSSDMTTSNCQLIYTTHSPFLINRNFPRRVRLVRKGDAEEGTQFIEEARIRRYEPVRSALGIDCAQTLFMGSTNLVLEGPTDQYLLSEMVRLFVTRQNATEFLDLNSVVLTSADSASAVEKLLASSCWGDEPNPTVVVFLDNDQAGKDARDRITGRTRKSKKLIAEDFVLMVGDAVGTFEKHHKIVTLEDILDVDLYASAIRSYIERWYPDIFESKSDDIRKALDEKLGVEGLVAGAQKFFDHCVFGKERCYDKFGVLQEVVALLGADEGRRERPLYGRARSLCHTLREKIDAAEREQVRASGKQAIGRIIGDFMKVHREGCSVFELQTVLRRLDREADYLGVDR